MMKHLSLYETYNSEVDNLVSPGYVVYYHYGNNKKYWLLPTDDRFESSLEQIGCPRDEIEDFLENSRLRLTAVVFIGFRVEHDRDCWGWNEYRGSNSCTDYDYSDYIFKGLVNMEEGEPELLSTTNKYNL